MFSLNKYILHENSETFEFRRMIVLLIIISFFLDIFIDKIKYAIINFLSSLK
jgi:hypothetical protein